MSTCLYSWLQDSLFISSKLQWSVRRQYFICISYPYNPEKLLSTSLVHQTDWEASCLCHMWGRKNTRTVTHGAAALPDWDWLSCDSPGRSYCLCRLIYGILLNYPHCHSAEWFRQIESLHNWRSMIEKVLHFRPVIKNLIARRWSCLFWVLQRGFKKAYLQRVNWFCRVLGHNFMLMLAPLNWNTWRYADVFENTEHFCSVFIPFK